MRITSAFSKVDDEHVGVVEAIEPDMRTFNLQVLILRVGLVGTDRERDSGN